MCIVAVGVSMAQIDVNLNGISDLWESEMDPIPLPLSADLDGDGLSNGDEAVAGTDPRNANSNLKLLQVFSFRPDGSTYTRVGFPSKPGKQYFLEYNTPDNQNFRRIMGPLCGTGNILYTWINQSPFSFGCAHAELWRERPADVTVPGDLASTTVPPDIILGLTELSLDKLDFAVAAVRIRGQFRNRGETGDYKFGLACDGPAEFHYNPTGGSYSGMSAVLSHDGLTAKQGATHSMTKWHRRAMQLLHLPANPAKPQLKVSVQEDSANPTAPAVPRTNSLIPWFETKTAIADLLDEPAVNFRVSATDADADADGVTDWEELDLGLSPMNSVTYGSTDMANAIAILNGGNHVVRITAPNSPTLVEELQNRITFTVQRLQGSGPLTVPIIATGVDASDLNIPAEVSLAGDQQSATFQVRARNDSKLEPAEVATVSLQTRAGLSVSGANTFHLILEDEVAPEPLLFSAAYQRENGPTEAWGYASITLAPDRRTAFVSSQFQNLTSPQNNAHIHRTSNGSVLQGLPLGTFNDYVWQLGAPFNMDMPGMNVADASLQATLDMLVSGGLYANVHTMENPAGEIYGTFLPADAGFEFVPPDPLPRDPGTPNPTDRDAFRFLEQASFGPTDATLASVKALGIDAWLDRQMDPVQTPHLNFLDYCLAADGYDDGLSGKSFSSAQGDHQRNLYSAWYNGAIHGKDQLRQRVAFALSQIFVTSTENSRIRARLYGMASYYDMLADNAFGNYRELLDDVSHHPIMGVYLSHLSNAKANAAAGTKPDENYAREIMQLFSIGLFERHPDGTLRLDQNGLLMPTYDNEDITELARVFTGLGFSKHYATENNVNTAFYHYGGPITNQISYLHPMRMFNAHHDQQAKVIVGGVALPARSNGNLDIADALDALHNHPSTPSFIATRLIKRLVTSNPSRGYVYRVAEAFRDNGNGERGDLAAVVKAIYLDQEARNPTFYQSDRYGKLREPVLIMTAACRAFPVTNDLPLSGVPGLDTSTYEDGAIRMQMSSNFTNNRLAQTPMNAPSVFNWFLPEFSPGGVLGAAQLTGPEFQTRTDPFILHNINFFSSLFWQARYNLGTAVNQDPAAENLRFDDSTAYLEDLAGPELVAELNRKLFGGTMSPGLEAVLLERLPLNTNPRNRVRDGIHMVLNAPEFVAQR